MKTDERMLNRLAGFRSLEEGRPPGWFWNSAGGGVAYGGALRLFPFASAGSVPSFGTWNDPAGWKAAYGELAPEWDCIGEDAFGVQYLLQPGDTPKVALFWSETGEVEHLGVTPSEFLLMIIEAPDNTVSSELYAACVRLHGELPPSKHFAMRVESALGGEMVPGNFVQMDSSVHMRALGKIARQVSGVALGTPLVPKGES